MISEFPKHSVFYFYQDETLCGRRETGEPPIPSGKELFEIAEANGSSSDLQESPRHVPDHVMQESITLNCEMQTMSLSLQLASKNVPDGAGNRCIRLRKAGKVVFSQK